jgi:hypothetical protein
MLDWKKWVKILLIIPPTFLYSIDDFMLEKNNNAISYLLAGKVLGQTSLNEKKVFVLVAESLIYLVIFNILYGNYISEDFRYSSVYLFSRLKNRKNWFYKKAFELLFIAGSYTIIFLGTNLFICKYSSTKTINRETWIIFMMLFAMLTMILTITTMAINLISLKYGNSIGFISVYVTFLVLIYIALKGQYIPLIRKYPILMAINPACGISFNFTEIPYIQVVILFYYLVIITASFYFGANYVNKLDISLSDSENN